MTVPARSCSEFDHFIDLGLHVFQARSALDNVIRPRPLLRIRHLPRLQACEFFGRHAGPRQHPLHLHVFGRAHDDADIDPLMRVGLEEERDLEHGELCALRLLLPQELDLCLDHERMDDGFQLLQPLARARDALREQRAVDLPRPRDPWEGRLDGGDRLTLVKAMHLRIGVEDRDPPACEMRGRRRLPHPHGPGEADDQHHGPLKLAAISARNSGVTAGRTPNQRSNPGTA